MALYTFIMDFDGGTYISQVSGSGIAEAKKKWGGRRFTEIPRLTPTARDEIRSGMSNGSAVALEGLKNAWCTSFTLRNKLALVNIVKTSP